MQAKQKTRQKGVVLIAVVWGVFILATMAFALSALVRSGTEEVLARKEHLQGYFLARGALYEAIPALKSTLSTPDGLATISKGGQPALEWNQAGDRVRVEIADENGKLDLNAAPPELLENLFMNFGMNIVAAHDLVAAIGDWRDRDDDTRMGGAESSYYLGLKQPYRAANRDFRSVRELLLVRGVTPQMFYGGYGVNQAGVVEHRLGLVECLTVYSHAQQVNINFAPLPVLLSVPGISPRAAQYIVEGRAQKLFASVEDFTRRYPVMLDGATLSHLTAGTSGTYTLVASGTAPDGITARVRAIVQVQGFATAAPQSYTVNGVTQVAGSAVTPPPFVIWSWDDSYVR